MAVDIYLDESGQPDYKRSVVEAAHAMGVDPQIALRMMATESSGQPNATSPKGAQGLFQLMPHTAQAMGVTDPNDPAQNIEGGLKYFKSMMDRYKGNMPLAVAAYNAGPDAVDKAQGVPNYPETQAYVDKVLGQQHPVQPNLPQDMKGGIQGMADFLNPSSYTQTGINLKNNINSGLDTAKDYVTNKANWPTIGGIAGGLAMAPFTEGMSTLPLIASMGGAAGLGGATGEAAGEYASGKPFNPMDILKQGAIQGGIEATGTGIGRGLRRVGADMVSYGAGLGRTGLKRDFPGTLQQILEGGRFTAPQITAGGAQRVMDRVGPMPDQLIARQAARGVPGDVPSQAAKRGLPELYNTINQGSEIPITEANQVDARVQQFIDEQARRLGGKPSVPGTTQPQLQLNSQNIPYLHNTPVPGTPAQEVPWTLPQQQAFKREQQSRGAKAMLANKQGTDVAIERQISPGLSKGAQVGLEDKVPGLRKANQTVQRQMGVLGSLNPSGVSAEQLVEQGISPEVANSVITGGTRSPFSPLRLATDLGVFGTTSLATHDPLIGAAAGLGTAALTSPLGMRAVGAGTYVAGRALPMATRAAHAQYSLTPSESRALQLAIQGK